VQDVRQIKNSEQQYLHSMRTYRQCTSIGKLWGDGGLADLLVDSGVYAACTVEQMLSGKQFNRAVRGLTRTILSAVQ
jgi:hypothetical protein